MQSERSDGTYTYQADAVPDTKKLPPTWRMKRRSALDRHAMFVKRLERHRLAQAQSGQDQAKSKLIAADRLRTFTKKLRYAILSNGDVATGWRPAAHVLDINATLDSKLDITSRQGTNLACTDTQMSHCKAASSELPNSVLKDLSQLVDSALSQAPLCSDSLAASQADYLPAARHHLTQRTGHSAAAAPNPTAELGSTSKQHQQSEAGQTCADVHTKGGITTYVKDSLASGVSSKTIGSKKVNKPAWALTADAARDVEQQEEEDLLAFAGGLEFDKYIDEQEDAELKTVLQEIRLANDPDNGADKATLKRHVVRAINNLAGKDVKDTAGGNAAPDAQSCAHQSEGAASTFSRATMTSNARDMSSRAAMLAASHAAADTAAKWDSSTRAGSDVGSMGNLDKDSCGDLFRENPEMKKLHSSASAAALLKMVAVTGAV